MNICLIRHGETDWNAEGRLQGRQDIPLNETGKAQALQCAKALKSRNWKGIVTSPLLRTRQTAEIIAEVLSITNISEDAGLIERDYGKASGLTAEEREAMFPSLFDDGKNYAEMEEFDLLRDRAVKAVIKAAENFYPEDIILVSHGGTINAVLAKISGGEIGSGKTRLVNAGINMLTFKEGVLEILFYNKAWDELLW